MIRVYKKKNRIQFICSDFQSYEFNKSFDIIFSLANHSTFDKGITDTQKYFEKVKKIISSNGILFLESHAHLYEKPSDFEKLVDKLKKDFVVLKKGIYNFGNFFDRDRMFYLLKKNN